jgi:hypothetical protein
MIEQQEIDAADHAVEKAETALDEAEARHATTGSPTAVAELLVARGVAHTARDKARRLRAQRAAEHAARDRREAAEQATSRDRAALVEKLAAARDQAARKVAALDQAATEALRAVAEYGDLVRQTSAELQGKGLRAGDGGDDGGARDGSVHLGGETWRPADGPGLVAYVLSATVAAHDRHHPLAQQRWRQVGGVAAQAGAQALLAPQTGHGTRP